MLDIKHCYPQCTHKWVPASQCHSLGGTERSPKASEATHAFCLSGKDKTGWKQPVHHSQQKALSVNSMELFWSHTMHRLCYLSLSVSSQHCVYLYSHNYSPLGDNVSNSQCDGTCSGEQNAGAGPCQWQSVQ